MVFVIGAQMCRQALDAVGQQGNLHLYVASVFFVFTVLFYDVGDFCFVVIDCHFF